MKIYDNVLDMIGQTPLLRISNMDTGPCEPALFHETAPRKQTGTSSYESQSNRDKLLAG